MSNGKAKATAKVEKPCLPASLEEAVKAKIKLDELRSIIEEVRRFTLPSLTLTCRCSSVGQTPRCSG